MKRKYLQICAISALILGLCSVALAINDSSERPVTNQSPVKSTDGAYQPGDGTDDDYNSGEGSD